MVISHVSRVQTTVGARTILKIKIIGFLKNENSFVDAYF